MRTFKGLFTIAIASGFLAMSCSQSAGKSAKVTDNQPCKASDKKGAACCVSKVPSRFTIVKNNDSLSVKKVKNN